MGTSSSFSVFDEPTKTFLSFYCVACVNFFSLLDMYIYINGTFGKVLGTMNIRIGCKLKHFEACEVTDTPNKCLNVHVNFFFNSVYGAYSFKVNEKCLECLVIKKANFHQQKRKTF